MSHAWLLFFVCFTRWLCWWERLEGSKRLGANWGMKIPQPTGVKKLSGEIMPAGHPWEAGRLASAITPAELTLGQTLWANKKTRVRAALEALGSRGRKEPSAQRSRRSSLPSSPLQVLLVRTWRRRRHTPSVSSSRATWPAPPTPGTLLFREYDVGLVRFA